MIDHQWRGRAAAAALLAGLLLSGCGSATPPAAPVATPAPGPTADATTGPTTGPPIETSKPAQLPWPAAGAADAAALQAAADSGTQPWLLDPAEVAMSYAAAAHGWTDAEASPEADGTSVDVRNSDGRRLVLTLAQPGRTGTGGIWVVTAEQPR
ncbi:hypothetical protein [Pseudonocardia sp.]|uniref:hypothetical protein n=1 Tax=Pseudonocardia sp. TaxID=60912 RepID=UPI0031FC51F3